MNKRIKSPEIDYAELPFPTDTIRIADIANQQSDIFDNLADNLGAPIADLDVMQVRVAEMELATIAFDHGLKGLPLREGPAEALLEDLITQYAEIGIGDGRTSRRILANRLIDAAAKQGSAHRPSR